MLPICHLHPTGKAKHKSKGFKKLRLGADFDDFALNGDASRFVDDDDDSENEDLVEEEEDCGEGSSCSANLEEGKEDGEKGSSYSANLGVEEGWVLVIVVAFPCRHCRQLPFMSPKSSIRR